MKKLLLALAFLASFTGFAEAQCNGTFANNTVCGNVTGSANLPRPTSPSAFLGAAGGTNGQTQYNLSGALGGYTPSGDVTVNPSTGVETIQPNAVTTTKIAPDGVTTNNIIANGVTNSRIAPGSAYTAKGTTDGISTADQSVNFLALPSAPGQLPAAQPSSSTVTMTIASPGVITWTAHGLPPFSTLTFTNNGDTLPTGFAFATTYYVLASNLTTNTFQLATTLANARAGTAIITTGAQAGTHIAVANLSADPTSVGAWVQYSIDNSSAHALTTGVDNIVIGGTYSAGCWLLQGNIVWSAQASTLYTELHQDISISSGTLEASPAGGSAFADHLPWPVGQSSVRPTGMRPWCSATAFTANVIAHSTFSGASAMLVYGNIWGVRFR